MSPCQFWVLSAVALFRIPPTVSTVQPLPQRVLHMGHAQWVSWLTKFLNS